MNDMKKRLKRTLIITLLPIISYFWIGPIEIYLGNQKDFQFALTDFIWIFICISIIFWLIISISIALFKGIAERVLEAVVLGFGIASYIQNMFMNIKLIENDGSPMKWSELKNFPIINLIIWMIIILLIIFLSLYMSKAWNQFSVVSATFLFLIQFVAIISLLLTPQIKEDKFNNNMQLSLSGEDQFKLSSKHNIIIFVLDSFGNTSLDNALKVYPDILDGLSDFTFYNNADCHYYCTFPSMTHMLTGNKFDFYTTSEKWMEDSWKSEKANGFYSELRDKEYICNLYSTDIGYVYGELSNLEDKFDNIKTMKQIVDSRKVFKLLGKLTVYKYAPYVVKPYFEVLTQDFSDTVTFDDGISPIYDNSEFYLRLRNEGLSIDKKKQNALIIQHIFGLHAPTTLDEKANSIENATIEETAKGLIVIVNEYLQQLKQLDIYDTADIIITADHGLWWGNDTQPIFFIKRANEKHNDIIFNSAPISLDDFQATILDLINVEYTEYGTSIFDWKEGTKREREVFMRYTDDEYSSVKGSSWNVYYGYRYCLDKNELNKKVEKEPDEILPATPW